MVLERLLNILDIASEKCSEFFKILSVVALAILILSFAYLVYGRYILNDTPTWVEQSSILLITFITFISASIGVRERTHISVEILSGIVSIKYSALLNITVNLILFGLGVFLVSCGLELYKFYLDIEIPILEIPQSIRMIPVILSGLLLSLFTLTEIVKVLKTLLVER